MLQLWNARWMNHKKTGQPFHKDSCMKLTQFFKAPSLYCHKWLTNLGLSIYYLPPPVTSQNLLMVHRVVFRWQVTGHKWQVPGDKQLFFVVDHFWIFWCWCYYLHTLGDSVSPVCRIVPICCHFFKDVFFALIDREWLLFNLNINKPLVHGEKNYQVSKLWIWNIFF